MNLFLYLKELSAVAIVAATLTSLSFVNRGLLQNRTYDSFLISINLMKKEFVLMAEQEFLASFDVEIDESGLDKLQKVLTQNRTLAEEPASAFDSAHTAVSEFFRQLSASTLPSGELSPYQRLMEMSGEPISFSIGLDVLAAEEMLTVFLESARQFFIPRRCH